MRDGHLMELVEFGERLAELRSIKGVSAREMSLSVGYSENYINKIENGKISPSMDAFFNICEYLGISPNEFFDTKNNDPLMVTEHIADYKRLDRNSQAHIQGLTKELVSRK